MPDEEVITSEELQELVEAVQPLKKRAWLKPLVVLVEGLAEKVIDQESRILTLED